LVYSLGSITVVDVVLLLFPAFVSPPVVDRTPTSMMKDPENNAR